ncbi:MAG: hypothetical protein WBX15_03960 [Thermoanaerobaculia bacterium]
MVVGAIIGIVVGVVFILAGIFKWGPLIVRNARGESGAVPASSPGYTILMVVIGLVVIGSSIAGLIMHH